MSYNKLTPVLLVALSLIAYIVGYHHANTADLQNAGSVSVSQLRAGSDLHVTNDQEHYRVDIAQTWLSVEDLPPLSSTTERKPYMAKQHVEIARNQTG